MKDFLIDKFKYDLDCNLKMIDAIKKNSNATVDGIFSHLLNAHHIWIHRINEMSPNFDTWQTQRHDKMVELADVNFKKIKRIIKNHEVDDNITYVDSKGTKHTNTLFDIMYHLLNHSVHHRGQVSYEISKVGGAPPKIDYISYKR